MTGIELIDGGRVALALAARHRELVDRVAVVATPAPDEQVPWLAPQLRAQLGTLLRMGPEKAYGKLGVPRDGAQVLAGLGVRDDGRLAAMFEAAYRQGPIGVLADTAGVLLRPRVLAHLAPGRIRRS